MIPLAGGVSVGSDLVVCPLEGSSASLQDSELEASVLRECCSERLL